MLLLLHSTVNTGDISDRNKRAGVVLVALSGDSNGRNGRHLR
jgi:hypothetical protein